MDRLPVDIPRPPIGVHALQTDTRTAIPPQTDSFREKLWPNLLANADFETVDVNGFAAHWYPGASARLGDNLATDTEEKHSGAASVRLGFEPNGFVTCKSERMSFKPHTNYGLIWWVKTAGLTSGCNAGITLQLPDRQFYLSADTKQQYNADWTRFEAEFTLPADAEWVQVLLSTSARGATPPPEAHACFDDVEFIEGRSWPEYAATACPLEHGAWQMLPELCDDFEAAALDSEKWKVWEWSWPKQKSVFTADNVCMDNGRLHLWLKQERVEGKPEIEYSSAYITSLARVRYGYFEISCRLTKALANNAFWFWLGVPGDYDRDGGGFSEIDVFEASAAERTDKEVDEDGFIPIANRVDFHLHAETPVDRTWHSRAEHWQAPGDLHEEFHRYGLEWDWDRIIVYFDGKPLYGWSNTHHHYPLALRLSVVAGMAGMPRPDNLPSAFEIEYVRAWQRTDVADTRIWDFQFALPDKSRRYRVPTTGGGLLVLFKGGERNLLKVDYLNPAFFASQTEPRVKKTVVAVDKDGKSVRFHFEWRFSVLDTEHNGYAPYRLYIEPGTESLQGISETFEVMAESGTAYRLQVEPCAKPDEDSVETYIFETEEGEEVGLTTTFGLMGATDECRMLLPPD